jgi:hypothetical protein
MSVSRARSLGAAAAVASAILYLLIGFEVLAIGEARSGEDEILMFGLTAGLVFAIVAVVIWRARSRWPLALAGLFDAAVIVAYVAFAGAREPAFEPWGLLVKACQVVLLAALAYLLARGPREAMSGPLGVPS